MLSAHLEDLVPASHSVKVVNKLIKKVYIGALTSN